MKKISVPSAYSESYVEARQHNPYLADNYAKHIMMGDPELDSLMRELSSLPTDKLHRYIGAGIEQQEKVLKQAPMDLRSFFDKINEPPSWLDKGGFRPGQTVFLENVDLMLVAFVTGVLVEGFSTLIAKSFKKTGRVAGTTRRLQQNNRHMMDIFFPHGLDRNNDGWKLSTRIRFVHSRIRLLLEDSEQWNHEAWGTPVSAAHLGFAISVFSKRLLDYSIKVGARFTEDEKNSVMAVWRYAGYLMGIPESILYADSAEAEQTYKIGFMVEPPADADSIAVANLLIQSIPSVAGVTSESEKKELTDLAYRLSRALIGNKLADEFEFPKHSTIGTLIVYRMKQHLRRILNQPQLTRSNNFTQLLKISVYDDYGISYKLPDHVNTSKSSEW